MKAKITAPPLLKFDWFPPGPIAREFVASDALMCGIRGPFGSGKSTACIAKLLRNFSQQKPGPDGIIRRRTGIIRNTYAELSTTTIKTWQVWVPPTIGKWNGSAPPSHTIKGSGFIDPRIPAEGFEWEVLFIALDRPEDLKKILSMDLSDAWINESREISKPVVDGLTGRVGRFPRTVRDKEGKILHTCAAPQIIMDTNPPDEDHWWAKMADFADAEMVAQNNEIALRLIQLGTLRPNQPLRKFFSQPSGRSPEAENLRNLPDGYYERLMADKSKEWIKVYVDGEYGFVQEGKAVYPEYRDSMHCQEFSLNRALPLYVGIDFGLTPAAIFGQRTLDGAWRLHSEVASTDMSALEFGPLLARIMQERYAGFTFAAITGDPAGEQRSQTDARTPFQALRAGGIDAKPAHTNDFTKRRDTFASFLNRNIGGEPGMLIHPNCKTLRKGLAGSYHYRRIQVSGDERYEDKPVKDATSHACEAGQYMLLGAGEERVAFRAHPEFRKNRLAFAEGVNDDPLHWRN
jgi:hypothetical protein